MIPVPDRLLSVYAVAMSAPPSYPPVPDEGGIAVEVLPIDQAPLPAAALLRATGAGPEALVRLGDATHAALVRSVAAVTFPPAGEFAAYATAAVLAADTEGLLIDTVIPRVVERPRGVGAEFRLADWMVLPYSAHDGRLWFTSKGMTRFGLPEVQSRGVPERLATAWGAVLTGIAQVLLDDHARSQAEHPGRAFRELPAEQTLSLRDVAAGYHDRARNAAAGSLDATARFRVSYDPATIEGVDSYLTVIPPLAEDGTTWADDVVRRLFAGAPSQRQ